MANSLALTTEAARQRLFGGVPERDFQQQVIEMAQWLGWRVYHPWRSDHSAAGWPDLAMARPPRFLMAELKSERGQLSTAQSDWLAALRACGIECHVWRPSMLAAIEATLRRE